jgi:hypothetical protein
LRRIVVQRRIRLTNSDRLFFILCVLKTLSALFG